MKSLKNRLGIVGHEIDLTVNQKEKFDLEDMQSPFEQSQYENQFRNQMEKFSKIASPIPTN